MSSESPTVFIVDDDASYSKSVARLLRASGFGVETFSSAHEFLERYAPGTPGCVIADLQMPEMNGIELQEALVAREDPFPIIFLTGCGDIPTTVTAMRQGAEDFLTKLAPRKELLQAVRRALLRDEQERQKRTRRRELQERFAKLTPRDREVMEHVLRGRLNKQIAAELGIDERSVKRHRTSMMGKLEVESVAELAHLAHEAGMIGAESSDQKQPMHQTPPRP